MLISLRIENFALIDQLELPFGAGLNVLTGETGAGKSIILDSIDAVLGGRITGRAIRTGAGRAVIEATFKLNLDLSAWLELQEIDSLEDDWLVCSREMTLSSSGVRSRSRVNGVLVNKQQMEELRDRLVSITAQGQTVQLGKATIQREWLDNFGGDRLLHQREQVSAAFSQAQSALKALEKRRQAESQRLQQRDIFQYQAKELAAASLGEPDELEQLEQERQRLGHSVELQQQSYDVYQRLYQNEAGGEAAADLVGKAEAILQDMVRYDPQVQPILELVSGALAQIEEAGREMSAYGDDLDTDPERLQEVESRIVELKQLCRKYGPTLADAIAHYDRISAELAELEGEGQSIEALESAYAKHQAQLRTVCDRLTELRREAAIALESRLISELKPLAMDNVQFQVGLTPSDPSASGADRITFLLSPNPGEPLQPLADIASGGEMSRFLLALKACFSQIDPIGTLIFDEIDVGVSGRVAQAIAEKLHHLGQHHQVLCVTHQPLVAAMADHHFQVNKEVIDPSRASAEAEQEDVRTVVRVSQLDSQQRREELAQLAGGQSAQEAIAFADSLLSQANDLRQAKAMPDTAAVLGKPSKARSRSRR